MMENNAKQDPFGYFRPTFEGWEDCAESDEGAIPLYEHSSEFFQMLVAVCATDDARMVFDKLREGQGVNTQDGQTWIAAKRMLDIYLKEQ